LHYHRSWDSKSQIEIHGRGLLRLISETTAS
jgi:hypothetical protein